SVPSSFEIKVFSSTSVLPSTICSENNFGSDNAATTFTLAASPLFVVFTVKTGKSSPHINAISSVGETIRS
ncbi:hypothetical protein VCHENC02_1609B, partial [Vibrio harveyi]